MKKFLVMSDVHANYPALQAIEAFVRGDRFHRVVNAGDMVVYCTFPNETIEWFRKKQNTLCIVGNTDNRVLRILAGEPLERPRREEKRVMYYWTCENLLPGNAQYLQSLPGQRDFTVDGIRIGVSHGTSDDEEETLSLDVPESRFRELARKSLCQVQIMGHSHAPFHKVVDGVHFLNPGSAGRMFDGDPRASFAILSIDSGKISVEHFRIPYPVEQVILSLTKNRLPAIYRKMYETGRKLNETERKRS
jgi:putative phosphoesterase